MLREDLYWVSRTLKEFIPPNGRQGVGPETYCSKPLEEGVWRLRGSGNGQMNSSPAINSLLILVGLVHTTRQRSDRLLKKTSTIWPGTIWPRNRSRTPHPERSSVDESLMRPPLPEPVNNGALMVSGTRLTRRT